MARGRWWRREVLAALPFIEFNLMNHEEKEARRAGKKSQRDNLAGRSAKELERPSAAWFVRACALAR